MRCSAELGVVRPILMRLAAITFLSLASIFIGSLFLNWTYDRSTNVSFADNPLWDGNHNPKANALTSGLQNLGLSFRTDVGEAAYPSGVAFTQLRSDEYWIVTFLPESKQVHAFALVHGVTWFGHLSYDRRFQKIADCITDYAKRK